MQDERVDAGWIRALPSLPAILLIALVLRFVWALFVPVIPVSDSHVYDVFAQRIADGLGYTWPDGNPTVYWAVGASAFYAGVYALFGKSLAVVAAVNLVLGVLLVWAIYALARTRFDERVARLAALLAALWPSWIAFTSIMASELLSNLLFTAGMAVILSRRRYWVVAVALGALLLVAAAYVRPTVLPLVLLVPLFDALIARRWVQAGAGALLALIIAGAALAPWAARNDRLFGKPVLVSANFGANLWMGNNPASTGGYMNLPGGLPANEVERDDLLKTRAIAFIRNDPFAFADLSLNRIRLSFDRETIAVAWNDASLPAALKAPLKLVMSAYWLLAFLLSIGGLLLYLWRDPLRILDPLTLACGLFGAVAVLVVGNDRYHFALMPLVAIFAAYALASVSRRSSSQ